MRSLSTERRESFQAGEEGVGAGGVGAEMVKAEKPSLRVRAVEEGEEGEGPFVMYLANHTSQNLTICKDMPQLLLLLFSKAPSLARTFKC